MRAYVALPNSRFFIRLVSFRSVTFSGGQFDLSRRFVAGVFIPNLWEKAEIPMMRDLIRRLAKTGDVPVIVEKGRAALLTLSR
jgi:hypothetical protein